MLTNLSYRLKNLEDEWQFVESPNDGTEEPADPHMSTPKPSPSPTPQSTTENATENATKTEDAPADNVDDIQTETDTAKDNDVVVESPKSEETPEVTAGNIALQRK